MEGYVLVAGEHSLNKSRYAIDKRLEVGVLGDVDCPQDHVRERRQVDVEVAADLPHERSHDLDNVRGVGLGYGVSGTVQMSGFWMSL